MVGADRGPARTGVPTLARPVPILAFHGTVRPDQSLRGSGTARWNESVPEAAGSGRSRTAWRQSPRPLMSAPHVQPDDVRQPRRRERDRAVHGQGRWSHLAGLSPRSDRVAVPRQDHHRDRRHPADRRPAWLTRARRWMSCRLASIARQTSARLALTGRSPRIVPGSLGVGADRFECAAPEPDQGRVGRPRC